MNEQVRYYIQRFQEGDRETASYGLLELNPFPTNDLIGLFHTTTEPDVRRYAAWIIRMSNDPTVLSFFEEIVYDPDPEVWKEGMDGLVVFASQSSLKVLETAKNRQFNRQQDALQFREWLEEAIEQVKETIQSRQNQTEASPTR